MFYHVSMPHEGVWRSGDKRKVDVEASNGLLLKIFKGLFRFVFGAEMGDFMDDLFEGFAELYRLAVNGGQSCGECVRKTTYPIKESAKMVERRQLNEVNVV